MKTLPGSTLQIPPKAELSSTTPDEDKSSYNNVIGQIIRKNNYRDHRPRGYPAVHANLTYPAGGLISSASGARTQLYK